VDSGADVDRFDRHLLDGSWKLPLTAFKHGVDDTEKKEMDRLFLCNKFLLQSGADPTIYATIYSSDKDNEDSSLFRSLRDVILTGSVVSLSFPSREPTWKY
jgi:hypothetical protein